MTGALGAPAAEYVVGTLHRAVCVGMATSGSQEGDGPRWARPISTAAGMLMLGGAALNACLTATRPAVYRDLGDWLEDVAPWSIRPQAALWRVTFGTHPRAWGALVGVAFEAGTGVLALHRDPRRRLAGLTGVTAFHAGLLVMGLWGWALPVLGVVGPAAVATARARHCTFSGRGTWEQ